MPEKFMYNSYYHFRESPFGVTPDPQFYYSNAVYQEAWAALRYGIEGRKGFIVISGEAGTGKTTLLRKALHDFSPKIEAAYIPNALFEFTDLLRLILKDLGLPSSTHDKFGMMEQLNRYLLEQFDRDQVVAVLMDEAQDLSIQCFEELRLLGNLETDKHKLLQIVLVGQPALERKLNQPELLQLKQRIVLRCRLRPIEAAEVGAYIESRLRTIGWTSTELFDAEAIEEIAFYSNGIPRLINIICDNGLLTAYAVSKFKVRGAMINEVAHDLAIFAAPVMPQDGPRSLTSRDEDTPSFAPVVSTRPNASRPDAFGMHKARATSRRVSPASNPTANNWIAVVLIIGVFAALVYSERGQLLGSKSPVQVTSRAAASDETTPFTLTVDAPRSEPVAIDAQTFSVPSNIGTDSVSNGHVAAARPEEKQRTTTTLQAWTAPIASGNEEFKPQAREKAASDALFTGNFFVSQASFVRSKPTSSADIIATFEPGRRITVVGRTGPYYRVRSHGRETVRGYVHEEDAFFERP